MKKLTITLYDYNELSAKAKAKALADFNKYNNDPPEECVYVLKGSK